MGKERRSRKCGLKQNAEFEVRTRNTWTIGVDAQHPTARPTNDQ